MPQLREIPYNREAATDYARRWALGRNSAYANFDSMGGDCTAFASQCLYAGCGVMNHTPTLGWYYNSLGSRAPAWTGVEFFYRFLTTNKGPGPYGHVCSLSEVVPGDFIQLAILKEAFHHTPVVLSTGHPVIPPHILIAAHSRDVLNMPLSDYPYYRIRCIHIDGARKWEGYR